MKLHLIIYVFLISSFLTSRASGSENSEQKKKYEINEIEFIFKGTETFDKEDLLSAMILSKQEFFSREELEQDKQRLKKFYFDNGFFDAIVDTSVEYNNEEENIDITIVIIENIRYKIDDVKFRGLDYIPENLKSEIFSEQLLKIEDFYNKRSITKEASRIIDILQNNGYLLAQIDSVDGTVVKKYGINNPRFRNKVIIELSFTGLNKVYYFGPTKINIIKNKYNLDKGLITRELTFSEGQLYSKELIIQSERNFIKLAIIQNGRIKIDTILEEQNKVNLIVNINLNNKYEISPNFAGVSILNLFYIGGGAQYFDKNFFGGGRTLTIELNGLINSPDANQIELSVSLFQPYFIKNTITATLSSRFGLYNLNETKQLISSKNLLRLSYFIAEYTFYQNAYSDITLDLNRVRYKKDDFDEENLVINKAGTIFNSMNSTIGLTLIHNTTNNFLTYGASKGLYHSMTFEHAGLIPRIVMVFNPNTFFSQYFKLYIPNSYFIDISDGKATSVIATNFEMGDIIEYGVSGNIVPVESQYKFYSGGGSSLRGWGAQQNGILSDLKNGGNFLIEGSFEFRRKMFPLRQKILSNITTVFFLDYGNVWEKHQYFKFEEIALAVGLGFRYDTFIGPIRLDIGFKLYDPTAEEGNKWLFSQPRNILKNKYSIQFGLGQAF